MLCQICILFFNRMALWLVGVWWGRVGWVAFPPSPLFAPQNVTNQSLAPYLWLFLVKNRFFAKEIAKRSMAKKTFVPSARLVKGARWYIDYTVFDPETGKEHRRRRDFDLNDIPNLVVREQVGQILCKHLPELERPRTPKIKEPETPAPYTSPPVSIKDAVSQISAIKQGATTTRSTKKDYRCACANLCAWMERQGHANRPAPDFGRQQARAYWDHLCTRKTAKGKQYGGKTLNNKLTLLRSVWSEMLAREMVKENVFQWVKPAREEEKTRRAFTDDEKRAVAAEIEKTDYWMFRGVLLQYFCYIRPIELTRLRFRDFDLGAGTVTVEVHKGKAHRRFATIPASIMNYFVDGKFDAHPGNHFVFGLVKTGKGQYDVLPSTVACCENRPYKRHRKVLERLRDRGDIRDIEGLTWYSWKDTGISRNANETSPLSTRDQAGHSSFDMTLKYYRAPRVIPEYKDLPNDLL